MPTKLAPAPTVAEPQSAETLSLDSVLENTVQLPPLAQDAIALLKKRNVAALLAGVPRGEESAARTALVSVATQSQNEAFGEIRAEAEQEISTRPQLVNALAVADYFRNTAEGAVLHIHNTQRPRESVEQILSDLGQNYQFIEIGVAQDVDAVAGVNDKGEQIVVQPIDPICDALATHSENGVNGHVLTQIAPGKYSEVLPNLIKHSMLGSQPGRDMVQVFIDRVYDPAMDRNGVTRRTAIGGLLGRRAYLDLLVHVAEPLDGNRDTGFGAVGGLKGVTVAAVPGTRCEYLAAQRKTLATHGINTLRNWAGVGTAVCVSNRSLLEGTESVYSCASPTRLRGLVQAIFHATAEHVLLGSGQRSRAKLEIVTGAMNRLINNLKAEGYVKNGLVTIDDESLTLRISVFFLPAMPIDTILLEYRDHH